MSGSRGGEIRGCRNRGRDRQGAANARCLLLALALLPVTLTAEKIPGLKQPVEILRDTWGVPHIYAKNTDDLFFAQGWITAKDRLFQIDLWRRQGTGKLAEVLGESAVARDRIARLVRFRGDWNAEWASYSPDTKQIATAFANGINAYIKGLSGKRPIEFEVAGYDPGLWAPEDVVARVAGLLMTRNASNEVSTSLEVSRFGAELIEKMSPPDPFVKLQPPKGLELSWITRDIIRDYSQAVGNVRLGEQGSNNWVVSGAKSATGKPILANDPHRPILLPSLRKTVHLVAPGWNAIGAGEPALPGIALGHNEHIAFGFTIVGIDQQDLYVEKLNPANPNQYRWKGAWKDFDVERQQIAVKGRGPQAVELKYSVHGPVIHEDRAKSLAYALKWVGAEPGGAGYLAALRVARATNWKEFRDAAALYKVPSENLVYADTKGNIGWIASGWSPVRKNWTGLFPVPGDNGEYEWDGYLPIDRHPQEYNPARNFIATANHKILPEGYKEQLSYNWAPPYRYQRIAEVLGQPKKFTVADFEALQQDVLSVPARRFQAVLKKYQPARHAEIVRELLAWDGRLTMESRAAAIYEMWIAWLPSALFGEDSRSKFPTLEVTLRELETRPNPRALDLSLEAALGELRKQFPHPEQWKWGSLHKVELRHPLGKPAFHLPAMSRPGDAHTVNSTSGNGFRQTSGASYRQIVDLADWDRSVMTNVPGESGDPASPHYKDLYEPWAKGQYHPLPYSRKAVEQALGERIALEPR